MEHAKTTKHRRWPKTFQFCDILKGGRFYFPGGIEIHVKMDRNRFRSLQNGGVGRICDIHRRVISIEEE
jgi:hypothetical protein